MSSGGGGCLGGAYVAPTFLPMMLPKVRLWLDGTDIKGDGTVPISGSMSTWVDKSLNKNDATQVEGSLMPFYNAAIKGVYFDGNLSEMTGAFSQNILGNSDWTVAAVGMSSSLPGISVFCGIGDSVALEASCLMGSNASQDNAGVFGTFGGSESYVGVVPSSQHFSLMGTYQASDNTATAYTSNATGNHIVQGTGLNITVNLFSIGRLHDIDYKWNGYLFEFIVCNQIISSTQRTQLFKYLTDKWSIVPPPP